MRDGSTGHRAEHRQRVAVVAAAELSADRGAHDAAGSRLANHTEGTNGLANGLVPALLARAIDRDEAHHWLDADDASGEDGRRMPVVAVCVTAAAAAIMTIGQRSRRAEKPEYGNDQKFFRQHGCSPSPCDPFSGPWSAG